MMELPLDQLRAFAAVIDHGTFEAAARGLQVTPSAISQRIKALEGTVGRVLLQRSKPVRTTESGETVLRLARQLTLLEAETVRALGAESASDVTDAAAPAADAPTAIPIVINSDSLATWALPALARVASAHSVVFDVFREDQDHSTARLRDGSAMAAITSVATPVQGCEVSALGRMRYRPMASPEFAARWFGGVGPDATGATATALRVAPVVIYDRSDDLQDRYLRRHAGRRANPPRHFVPASAEYASAVRLGLGWGMLPEAQIGGLEASGELVAIGDEPIDVPLYWQQWRLHSRLLAAVAEEIAAAAAVSLR